MLRQISLSIVGSVRLALVLLVFATLQGCANLTAVREFGKTAAELSSYADAGAAFQESARTAEPYRSVGVAPGDRPDVRQAQVNAAGSVQASLAGYFATLAKLAGEDSFSLDAELDAIGKGLQGLPAGTVEAESVNGAIALAKTLQKYALARAQTSAVKELVSEGGPTAMRLLERLESLAIGWRGAVANDASTVQNTLNDLASIRDTPPLLSILARDRLQQQRVHYEQSLKRLDTSLAALRKIRTAHEAMAGNLTSLDSKELQAVLKEAVADLKASKKNLDALR